MIQKRSCEGQAREELLIVVGFHRGGGFNFCVNGTSFIERERVMCLFFHSQVSVIQVGHLVDWPAVQKQINIGVFSAIVKMTTVKLSMMPTFIEFYLHTSSLMITA